MSTLTPDTLLPCPFCAGTDLEEESTGAMESRGIAHFTCWIECNQCGMQGPSVELHDGDGPNGAPADYQRVRDAWNRRAALEQPAIPEGWKLVPDYQIGTHVRFNDGEYRILAHGDKPGTFDLELVPYDIKNSRWLSVHPDAFEPLPAAQQQDTPK